MPGMQVQGKAKQGAISILVTKADGSVIDYGVVAYYHRNPLIRWWRNRQIAKGKKYQDSDFFGSG